MLIDSVGSLAVAFATGCIKVLVDFNISYFSTAKINVRPHTSLLPHSSKTYSRDPVLGSWPIG